MLRLMVVTTVLILTLIGVGLAPTLSYIKTTNEGSYTYGYWRGSLTGPQFAPGSNWNPNTCGLSPSSILDNPKGAVIPTVTNTTACEDGKVGVATML
ncbi:MAG: hypothetical protein WBZ36_06540 [Candidatus Nitrosopolaris sp.]